MDFISSTGSIHLRNMSHFCNSISSIQSSSNLFVCHDKTFKLNIQILILALEYIAMRTKSSDFRLNIIISLEEIVVIESHIILLLAGNIEVVGYST